MTLVGVLFVLAFIVGGFGSIMLHEAGHFLTARRYGMKATQFFLGFGPTLWSRHRGETEYGIKAIPAGGFVKIVGMTPLEDVEPGDEGRAFYRQPWRRKTVVLSAGSLVHFAICLVLVASVVAIFGVPRETAPTLSAVTDCVGADPKATCATSGAVPGPAKAAGLRAGDVVVAVNGSPIHTADALVNAVKGSASHPVRLTVRRAGRELTLPVTPASVVRKGSTQAIGVIGVSVAGNFRDEHVGPVGVVKQTGSTISFLVSRTWDTLSTKLGSITKVYSKDRDPNGFTGVYGAGHISGEIGSAKVPLGERVANLVLLLASLNLFVGIFNLLPLLPLDGGHIAVVWFEATRDKLRRLRGYTGELQRVDMNKLLPLTFAVVVLFAGFSLFLLGADIVNPIRLGQ